MSKKILIVDDEPHIRRLLEQTMEEFADNGVEILTSGNGKEALEIIKIERPAIIYLDATLPGMNGYDVCNIVKNDLKLENVYIVMLTARGQEFDKQRGVMAGADVYMTKPFNPDAIIEKTSEVLGIKL